LQEENEIDGFPGEQGTAFSSIPKPVLSAQPSLCGRRQARHNARQGIGASSGRRIVESKSRGDGFSFTSKIMNAVGTKPGEAASTPPTMPMSVSPAAGKVHSTIASDMTITGNVVCEQGGLQLLGAVNGELRVADLVIGSGGRVEGDIFALNLVVEGDVKGTVHANHVSLHDSAKVAGDIYHSSLKIDRNALFEGMSRRMQTEMGSVKMQQGKTVDIPPRTEPAQLRPEGPKVEAPVRADAPRPQNGSGVVHFPGEHSAKV
jgi:cytoskeletal protein CcmA (bactofilin family)